MKIILFRERVLFLILISTGFLISNPAGNVVTQAAGTSMSSSPSVRSAGKAGLPKNYPNTGRTCASEVCFWYSSFVKKQQDMVLEIARKEIPIIIIVEFIRPTLRLSCHRPFGCQAMVSTSAFYQFWVVLCAAGFSSSPQLALRHWRALVGGISFARR